MADRFSVAGVEREGEHLVALRDGATGAEALVWPALGNNCVAATLPVLGGVPVEHAAPESVAAVKAPPSLAALRQAPAFWGIPLLFPFPSRVPRGEYEFKGRRYTMPRDFHGFALDRAWRVVSTRADGAGARLTSVLSAEDHPETLEGYPFPYRLEVTYELSAEGLRLEVRVANTGAGRMPFGYGAHPYFRLPLGERGSFGECAIRVPARRKWDTRLTSAVSDGTVPAWDALCAPVGTPQTPDLHAPTPLVERQYDGVYANLDLTNGLVECVVADAPNGLEAVMRATPNHGVVVVYTHRGAESVCFEPWTCPPNVFNLAERGVPEHGLTVLRPGEAWEGTMWLSLRRVR